MSWFGNKELSSGLDAIGWNSLKKKEDIWTYQKRKKTEVWK